MKKILIVILALCCCNTSFAQDGQLPHDGKAASVRIIHNAIITENPLHQQMLDVFIETYGLTSDALALKAIIMERQGNNPDARRNIDRAITIHTDSDFIDLMVLYNLRIEFCHEVTEQLAYANQFVKAYPKNYRTYLKRADIYLALDNYKEAIKDIKKAVRLTYGQPQIRTKLARIYIISGDDKRAMNELNDILKDYPNVSEARRLRAMIYFYSHNIDPFVEDFLYYLQLTHDMDLTYVMDVVDTAYDGIMSYADQILKNVISREDMAYWNYFEGYFKVVTERDVEEGIRQLDVAMRLTADSGDFRARIISLQILYYEGREDYDKELELIEEIEKIVRRGGDIPADWIHNKKAEILRGKNRYDEAVACLNQLIDNNRNRTHTDSTMLAYYYYLRSDINQDKLGNPEGALADIDSALVYRPDNMPYIYRHARICSKHFKYGDYIEKIKADCEKILILDTVPSADSYRHFAFAMLGRSEEAEAWLRQIIEKAGNDRSQRGLIDYNGACMYALMNDSYNATRLLMDALENGNYGCDQISEDADFDNIRETPEFKSILKIVCAD